MNQPVSGNKITRQFSQSLVTKILMTLLRMTRNIILARVLGPADRGFFSLVSSLPDLIMTAGNCGLANAASYQTANRKGENKTVLANINFSVLVLSIILFGASFLLVTQDWLVKDQVDKVLQYKWYLAAATVFVLVKVVNIDLINVLNRVSKVNIFLLSESLLPLLLFLVLWGVFNIEPLLAAVYSWFSTLAILAISSSFQLGHGFKLRFDIDIQRNLLHYGSRGYFDTLFNKLLLRMDFIFVSAMISSEALGYYSMATAAAELLLMVPSAMVIPFFSFFFKRGGQDKAVVVATVLRILLAGMVILAICFACFGKVLILLLFGQEYLPAYGPLVCLLPGVVALSYYTPVRLSLLGANRPGTISMVSGTACLLNLALNFVLLPYFGLNGVAISASIAYCFGAIVLSRVFIKSSNVRLKDTLFIKREDVRLLIKEMKSILKTKGNSDLI